MEVGHWATPPPHSHVSSSPTYPRGQHLFLRGSRKHRCRRLRAVSESVALSMLASITARKSALLPLLSRAAPLLCIRGFATGEISFMFMSTRCQDTFEECRGSRMPLMLPSIEQAPQKWWSCCQTKSTRRL